MAKVNWKERYEDQKQYSKRLVKSKARLEDQIDRLLKIMLKMSSIRAKKGE